MRMLIYGGTFNPVHEGHLFVCEEVRIEAGYDRVIFVPSNIPVHKSNSDIVDARHRVRMLLRAVRNNPAFLVDECEIARGGPSYMIDTVRYLQEKYEIEGKPGLLIGDDLIPGFSRWKQAGELASVTDLLVVRRNSAEEIPFEYEHRYFSNTLLPVSSSEIRARIGEGRAFRYLVPEGVFEYIVEHDVYRKEDSPV